MGDIQDIVRILVLGVIGVLEVVVGNIISIGPGLYESNHTLDGTSRAVYVLNSCEFMHNGRLQSVHFYAGSADWLAIQIWRPSGTSGASGSGSNTGAMKLVYQKYMEVEKHNDIYQVQFDINEVHVKSGDVVGFTKLNDSFPISYVFHPLQSVDIWYHNIDAGQEFPQIGDVIDFEEMGFPYRFSVTVRFWADIPGLSLPSGLNVNGKVLLDSNGKMGNKDYKDVPVSGKHKVGEGLQFVYNVTGDSEEGIRLDPNAEKQEYIAEDTDLLNNTSYNVGLNQTEANDKNYTLSLVNSTLKDNTKKIEGHHSKLLFSVSPIINPMDKNTPISTDKYVASATESNIEGTSARVSSSTESILNISEKKYSVSSVDSNLRGSTGKPQMDKNTKSQDSIPKSLPIPSQKTVQHSKETNITTKP